MRIFPFVLIAVGVFGLLKHFGFIDPAFVQLFWPLLLIGIGVAMLVRGPRWRKDMHDRMHERWEKRLHRRFGPGWAQLSEKERERLRAGMRPCQPHHHHAHGGDAGDSTAAAPGRDGPIPQSPSEAPAPHGQR